MIRIVSLIGSLTNKALPILLCILAMLAGYMLGREQAKRFVYEARIAAMNQKHAEQERCQAEAVAAAEKSAREHLAAATERGDRLAVELTAVTRALDAARNDLNRRIRHVSETAGRTCSGLPAEWVQLYNEALGLAGTGDRAGNSYTPSGGSADTAAAAGSPGSGIRTDTLTSFPRPPVVTNVPQTIPGDIRQRTISGARGTISSDEELTSPDDILAHIRDYGQYCRRLEAGYQALVILHTGKSP